MRKHGDIHILQDRDLQGRMVRVSLVVLALGLALAAALALGLARMSPASLDAPLRPYLAGYEDPSAPAAIAWVLGVAAATVASFAVHELVHGVAFKLFSPPGSKIGFGADWSAGMVYAIADGVVFTRRHYLAAVLAPTFAVGALALALGALAGLPVAGAAVCALHLSGCSGDWEYVRAIRADTAILYCMDTSWGVQFFCDGDDGEGDDRP